MWCLVFEFICWWCYVNVICVVVNAFYIQLMEYTWQLGKKWTPFIKKSDTKGCIWKPFREKRYFDFSVKLHVQGCIANYFRHERGIERTEGYNVNWFWEIMDYMCISRTVLYVILIQVGSVIYLKTCYDIRFNAVYVSVNPGWM